MRECFVELKRWHTKLLDVSINTSDSTSGSTQAVEEQLESDHDHDQMDQNDSVEFNESAKESTASSGVGEIWSPIRIARIVKKIRAIGRG